MLAVPRTVQPTPPHWQPFPVPALPPSPSKELKALETAWRKGVESLTSARATFERDVLGLAKIPSVSDAMRQAADLRPRLAELLRAELELRRTFPALVESCVAGWLAETERRSQALQKRTEEIRDLLAANGWPVDAPQGLPHCKQIPDHFHRNVDLARLRYSLSEAQNHGDQSGVLSRNAQAAEVVDQELARMLNGTFAGLARVG